MSNDVTANDSYAEKLKKTLPGEVTGVYLSLKLFAAQAIFGTTVPDPQAVATYLQTILPFMFLMPIVTVGYLYGMSKIRNVLQIALTVISFLIWAVAIDISYFAQAEDKFALPFPLSVVARNDLAFLMFVILWNFCIPIVYAFQAASVPLDNGDAA